MIPHLLKLLKEMLLHRCTKKETMSEVHKNNEKKKLLTACSLGRESRGTRSRTKNKQMNNRKKTIRIKMFY